MSGKVRVVRPADGSFDRTRKIEPNAPQVIEIKGSRLVRSLPQRSVRSDTDKPLKLFCVRCGALTPHTPMRVAHAEGAARTLRKAICGT